MVAVFKMKSHIVVVQQGQHTVEALASMRDSGGSSNWGCMCCHMEHWLVA